MTEEQKMFMQLLEDECVINTKADIVEYPPVAISMGETTIQTLKRLKDLTNSDWNVWQL